MRLSCINAVDRGVEAHQGAHVRVRVISPTQPRACLVVLAAVDTPVQATIMVLKVLSNAFGRDVYLDDLMARCCSLLGLITGKLPAQPGQPQAQPAAGGTTGQPAQPGQPPAQPAQAGEQLGEPAAECTLAEAYGPILNRFQAVLEVRGAHSSGCLNYRQR